MSKSFFGMLVPRLTSGSLLIDSCLTWLLVARLLHLFCMHWFWLGLQEIRSKRATCSLLRLSLPLSSIPGIATMLVFHRVSQMPGKASSGSTSMYHVSMSGMCEVFVYLNYTYNMVCMHLQQNMYIDRWL